MLSIANEDRTHTVSREDGAGNLQEQRVYTKDGKLLHEKRADGNLVEYSYGANALEKELHTARSKQAKQPAQQYRYNSMGKVCEIIDQEGASETFRYDREGRMILHCIQIEMGIR